MRFAILLFSVVFLIYASTFGYPFYFDDSHYIVNNYAIHNPANLLKLWTSASYYSVTPENWGYRPFTTFIQSLAWITGNGAFWPFHLEKIVLHTVTCFFLYRVWEKLWNTPGFFPSPIPTLRWNGLGSAHEWTLTPKRVAMATALFFAIHPANTEVMDYISASSTLLSGTCFIAAYFYYLRYRESPKMGLLIGALVLYALSVLAKEEGITLGGIIVLTEIFIPRRENRLKSLISFTVVGVLLALLLRYEFAESSNLARGVLSRWEYFITQWRAYLRYFRLLIWPTGMNADNLEFGFSHSFFEPEVLAALFGNVVVIAFAWFQKRRYPIFLFSVLWFYAAISPASSIIPLGEPVNDHRMYIAYFGLLGVVVPWFFATIDRVLTRLSTPGIVRRNTALFAVFGGVALAGGTVSRNFDWKDTETLWTDTVEKNPNSGRALNNLSIAFMAKGDWKRTRELLELCEQRDPGYPICRINQAIASAASGDDAEAEEKFLAAIAFDPLRPTAKNFYAQFLAARGRYHEAMQRFREVDEMISGVDLGVKLGWANAAFNVGLFDEVRNYLQDAARRFPGDPQIEQLLARVGPKP
jgi:tetratricopeptide (TPR) repeat protein